MTDIRIIKLEEVIAAAEEFRQARMAQYQARERFIDTLVAAHEARCTQRQIAERCVIEPGQTDHISRQRVSQFIEERSK